MTCCFRWSIVRIVFKLHLRSNDGLDDVTDDDIFDPISYFVPHYVLQSFRVVVFALIRRTFSDIPSLRYMVRLTKNAHY